MAITFRESADDLENLRVIMESEKIKTKAECIRRSLKYTANLVRRNE